MADYAGGVMQDRRADEEGEREAVSEHVPRQEPPSSQVGYGGGERTSEFAHHTAGGEEQSSPERQLDPRSSTDQQVTRKCGVYPTTDANCKPCDAGFGSCGRGAYIGQGGDRVSSTDHGAGDHNSRPSEAGSAGYVVEGDQAHQSRSYGITDQNAKPAEGGLGSAGPGGYVGEGGARRVPVTYKSQHYQDSGEHHGFPVPTRPPGAVLLDENHFNGPKYENEPTTTPSGDSCRTEPANLPEGEVRGGVPHGVVSGHPSGAGQVNHGASEVSRPVDGPVGHQGLEAQEYRQTGSLPGESAYSQQYTQPQGSNKHASEVEATEPTERDEANMAPIAAEDEPQEKGLIAKIKTHLPGHHKHHHKADVEE